MLTRLTLLPLIVLSLLFSSCVTMPPAVTTLTILSDPEGADVHDVSPAGFGYLGKTPLERNFTVGEVQTWVARRTEKGRAAMFDSVLLELKISNKGYDDVFLQNIRIPIGEKRAFQETLDPVLTEISFDSDPEGVHVYVVRTIKKDILNQETGVISSTPVQVERHLGQTPFTLKPDPSDPLLHGDGLLWKKSGYDAALNTTVFAKGQARIHHVMETVNKK
jgi:hypothetical protein